jgi:predicted dehydrogenase
MRAGHGPWTLHYRVHAGVLPPGSWYADPSEGGRLRGEGCHFVDLMQYLTDALPARVFATSVSGADDVVAQITFSDHSVGVLEYVSGGEPTRPKEVLTVVGNRLTAELTNFSSLTVWFDGHRKRVRSLSIDKGQRHTVDATIAAARRGGEAPISLPSLVATSACMIAMVESAVSRQAVAVGDVR